MIPYGPWEPDIAGINAGVLARARNAYALKNGWGPIPALLTSGTDAFPGTCVGLTFYRSADGGWVLIAGSSTKLYRLIGQTWTDYTRVSGGDYAVNEDEYWDFDQFGTKLIATNIADDVQVLDIDGGDTAFTALGGSPPKARYVAVVGDFVVLAALATNQRKLQNSALNSATGWTVGTDFCDEQEFPDGAKITGLAGGEFGWVVQEKAIRRMIFQPGSDIAFRFERLDQEHGASAGYSLISTANGIYFLSEDGFSFVNNAGQLIAIGADRINTWFHDNCDTLRLFSVIGFKHPFAPRICWAFFNSSGSTTFDRVLIYDWHLDRWAYAEVSAQYWTSFGTPGTTLEQLDVYGTVDSGDIPFPFDSRVWEGGQPVIGAVMTDGTLGFLEGTTPLDAQFLTAPLDLIPGSRAKIIEIEPIGTHNGASIAMRVGKQEHGGATQSFTASATPSTRTGVVRLRASGRLLQIETNISQSSGTLWVNEQGVRIEAVPDGQ